MKNVENGSNRLQHGHIVLKKDTPIGDADHVMNGAIARTFASTRRKDSVQTMEEPQNDGPHSPV